MKPTTHAISHVLKEFFLKHKGLVLSNSAFMLLVPINDILLPHLLGNILELIKTGKPIVTSITIVIIILICVQVGFMLSDLHDSKLFPIFQTFLREKLLNNVIEKYETNYTELNNGDIITKFVKVPTTMTKWFERIKTYMIPYAIVFLLAFVYFSYYDILIGLCLLVVIIAAFTIFIASPFACHSVTYARDNEFNYLHEEMDDIFRNLYSVYGAGQKEYEKDRIRKLTENFLSLYKQTMICGIKMKSWITPIMIAFLIIFFTRTYYMVSIKKFSAAKFVPMFIILLYLLNSVYVLNDQIQEIIFEWGIIQTASEFLVPPPPPAALQPLQSSNNIPSSGLGLANVTFSYPGTKLPLLNNLSLHIKDSEKVAIVGSIGSGKSTVLKLLLKYQKPQSGTLYINGKDYSQISLQELRKTIGYVPQYPILFNRSLIENILYGNKEYTVSDVEYILKYLELDKEFDNLEHGLYTKIGKNGSKLSGGQRQLIWCLRVLIQNPSILILDEPTASVDEHTKEIMRKMLNVIMKGKTVVMVTHDDFLKKYANRVITMDKGKIISDIYASSSSLLSSTSTSYNFDL